MTELCTDQTWNTSSTAWLPEDHLTDPTWEEVDDQRVPGLRGPPRSPINRMASHFRGLSGERIGFVGSQPTIKRWGWGATTMLHWPLDSAPWLVEKLQQLLRLQQLRQAWHASGAAPPNALAIHEARRVLKCCAQMDFEPQYVDPSVDEGVCLSFHHECRYADIECFNTGEILAAISSNDGETEIWEVSPTEDEINAALLAVHRFILQYEL